MANLAAFFTLTSVDAVTTMEAAVAAGYKVCAHPALKGELEAAWPEARFVFHQDAKEVSEQSVSKSSNVSCETTASE